MASSASGIFDAHVHAAPDVIPRLTDDTDLARHYLEVGAAGFVLKSHYESTVGRALAARRSTGIDVVGGIALNRSVGGLSPAAVFAALRSGGRVVWMPTVDAAIHAHRGQPRLSDLDPRLQLPPITLPPLDPSAEAPVRQILNLVAEHDAVLATGHVSSDECQWLVGAALDAGVTRIVATHPAYTVPDLGVDVVVGLAGGGVHIEITAHQMLHQPGCTPEGLAAVARAAGDRLILTSDVGQVDSPLPFTALSRLADLLVAQGIDAVVVRDAMTATPRRLFLADERP